MSPVPAQEILMQLQWRYATKHFDAQRKLSAQQWASLAEVLRLAPSSYGLQPWKFLLVQSPSLRAKLRPVSWGQPQIEECSHLLVMASLKKVTEEYVRKFIGHMAKERGLAVESLAEYQGMILGDVVNGPRAAAAHPWAQRQVYIAMGMLLESAALLNIDACPMEGIDPARYDEILGLQSSDYATVAVVALGFRAAADAYQSLKKVRFSANEVLQVME